MACPVENLHVGDYVALVRYLRKLPVDPWTGAERGEPNYNGLPFEIVAISYPFVALLGADGQTRPLDLREWALTKVTRQYAKTVIQAYHNSQPSPFSPDGKRPTSFRKSSRRKKQKPEKGSCPRCSHKLIQRMVGEGNPDNYKVKGWILYCDRCGYNGGPIEGTV